MGHERKILHLVRDRIGEKPLYYGWQNNVFIFSSELKALKKFPNFKADICKSALQLQLNYSYIPAPYSIFKNIYKLMPGNFISLKINSNFTDKNIKNTCYWYPKDKILKNKKNFDFTTSLDKLLIKTISNQSISDVPLGIFLSGGIDSSLIAAIAQKNSNRQLNSFSIGFDDKEFDEV